VRVSLQAVAGGAAARVRAVGGRAGGVRDGGGQRQGESLRAVWVVVVGVLLLLLILVLGFLLVLVFVHEAARLGDMWLRSRIETSPTAAPNPLSTKPNLDQFNPSTPKDDIICGNRAGALTVLLDVDGRYAPGGGEELEGEAVPTHRVTSMGELRQLLIEQYELLPPKREQS